MSNVGKWHPWYSVLPADEKPSVFGESPCYEKGAHWLRSCSLVEDWGCGFGWMRTLIPAERYRGIDGTASPFCDEVVDLSVYRSKVPGIFMRGVIEHNYDWDTILANALTSFIERMALVVFTPTNGPTRQIAFVGEMGVPDMAISLGDLGDVIKAEAGVRYQIERFAVEHGYLEETIFYLERTHG